MYSALTAFLAIGGTMLIFWSTLSNNVSPSDYIAFSSAFGMMTAAMAQMKNIVPTLAQIKPLLNSVKPILEAVPEMEAKAPQVEDLFGGIDISGLSFRYEEEGPLVLDNLSLRIEPGEYVGLVGRSGSGKSTFMRLLLGFEQPLSGGIYYDNYDLAKVDYEQFLAIQPQHFEAHLGLAHVLQKMGRKTDTVDELNRIVLLFPDSAQAYAARAAYETELGQYEVALFDWDEALRCQPSNEGYTVSKVDVLIRMNRRKEARETLDALVRKGTPRGALKEWYDQCK
jgi:tetratricopeptide (TPR) repeat protein